MWFFREDLFFLPFFCDFCARELNWNSVACQRNSQAGKLDAHALLAQVGNRHSGVFKSRVSLNSQTSGGVCFHCSSTTVRLLNPLLRDYSKYTRADLSLIWQTFAFLLIFRIEIERFETANYSNIGILSRFFGLTGGQHLAAACNNRRRLNT